MLELNAKTTGKAEGIIVEAFAICASESPLQPSREIGKFVSPVGRCDNKPVLGEGTWLCLAHP